MKWIYLKSNNLADALALATVLFHSGLEYHIVRRSCMSPFFSNMDNVHIGFYDVHLARGDERHVAFSIVFAENMFASRHPARLEKPAQTAEGPGNPGDFAMPQKRGGKNSQGIYRVQRGFVLRFVHIWLSNRKNKR